MINLIYVRVPGKDGVAGYHFSVEAADGPDVHFAAVVWVAHQQLGRAVPAGCHVVRVQLALCRHQPGKPEVAEFDHTELGDQDVLGFHVPMNNLSRRRISRLYVVSK